MISKKKKNINDCVIRFDADVWHSAGRVVRAFAEHGRILCTERATEAYAIELSHRVPFMASISGVHSIIPTRTGRVQNDNTFVRLDTRMGCRRRVSEFVHGRWQTGNRAVRRKHINSAVYHGKLCTFETDTDIRRRPERLSLWKRSLRRHYIPTNAYIYFTR